MTTQALVRRNELNLWPISGWQILSGLLAFATVLGVAAGLARLILGLGATTALNDAYPWGVWIGFDFALIALAGAGFTMAAAVHVFHLHRLQPALRPALLAGLLGYVAVLLLLVLDLGRPDRFYHFIIDWNLHSPLFEISWCVLLYTTVLVIEVSPDVFGRLGWRRPQNWARRVMAPATIIGVTLSTLHQSTLGTLYLNMPHRLDSLWWSPLLPLLFFVSAILAGLSLAILAYRLAVRLWGQDGEPAVILGLGKGVVVVGLLYLLLRLAAIWLGGELGRILAGDPLAQAVAIELGVGVVAPVLLLATPALRRRSWAQWLAPMLALLGVGLNRFNATLIGQLPPVAGVYSPHLYEWLSTLGILAGAALVWGLGIRFVLRPKTDDHHRRTEAV
jgi:Ni/Fe-hydrogenase subunit HybB-like protein